MKVLFLDESGDHNLTIIDPQYPLFVLGGVIIDKDYADGELTRELNAFRQELFGRTDIVLHTADITRNRDGFEQVKETVFRARFYDTQKFFDPFAGGKFAHYLFSAQEKSGQPYTQDGTRYLIDEAQLFIDAAHSCYNRISAPAPA